MRIQKNNPSKNGFSLTELVVSISLFTILIIFLSSSIYFLLSESKNVTFKNQGLFLAQQKLDEFVYDIKDQNGDIYYNGQTFAPPFDKFFYSVALGDYGTDHKIVLVDVWTGSLTNKKNNIQLSGLAYKDSVQTFFLPPDLSSPNVRMYFDYKNNQVILEESYNNPSWRYKRISRYDAQGNRLIVVLDEPYTSPWASVGLWGLAYNPAIDQWIGVITTQNGAAGTSVVGAPSNPSLIRQKNPLSPAYISAAGLTSGIDGQEGYGQWNTLSDINSAVACASDGTTYFVEIRPGSGWHSQSARIWIAQPTTEGLFKTIKTVNATATGNNAADLWGYPRGSSDFKNALGYVPSALTDIKVDKNDKVIMAINNDESSAVIEADKNLNNVKVVFPAGVTFTQDNNEYKISTQHAEKDKYGNIYVAPFTMYKKQGDGSWVDLNIYNRYNARSSGSYAPLYKFKETGRDAQGNPVLQFAGNATPNGAVIDFSMSTDGTKLTAIEGKDSAAIAKWSNGPTYYDLKLGKWVKNPDYHNTVTVNTYKVKP